MNPCEDLVDEVSAHFGASTYIDPLGEEEGCAIHLPLETFYGEGIHLYLRKSGGTWHVTDMGETLGFLQMYGIDFSKGKTGEDFERLKSRFNARHEEEVLFRPLHQGLDPEPVLEFANFLLAVSGLHSTRQRTRRRKFPVKVRDELDERDAPYESGRDFTYRQKKLPVDFTSVDRNYVFLAFGTVARDTSRIVNFTRRKLYSFLELDTFDHEVSLQRIAVLDEETPWPEDAEGPIVDHSDRMLRWPTHADTLEQTLKDHVEESERLDEWNG